MRKIAWVCLLASAAACGEDREPKDPFIGQPRADMGSMEDTGTTADLSEAPRCDSDTPCELTCEVLLDPGFCWNVGVAEAYDCMADAAKGTMAADGLSCGDGDWSVDFATAIVEGEVIDRDIWDFTVTRGGVTCADFEDHPHDGELKNAGLGERPRALLHHL